MPELPEVESARRVIVDCALGRKIVAVDDVDSYVCRPHDAAELQQALCGRRLVASHRRGKLIWCETSGAGHSRTPGACLSFHLGMGGRLVVTDRHGSVVSAGDSTHGLAGEHQPKWDRFTLRFADGRSLRLVDKRRLGRVRLNPDLEALGPDALDIDREGFHRVISRSSVAIKARLLDQSVIAGVGNLLADEILWQSRISPSRPANQLSDVDLENLYRTLRRVVSASLKAKGSHTGRIIPARHPDGRCPRCGAAMRHGTVGGRSTWWCEREQA
jgi:formamidopyrimidine-DNA glycosylase